MGLIDSIKDAQAKRGWSDGELSRQLGIAQSQWSRIQSGQREMGLRFLRAVAKLFPELQWKIADYVIKGGNQNNALSNKDAKGAAQAGRIVS